MHIYCATRELINIKPLY